MNDRLRAALFLSIALTSCGGASRSTALHPPLTAPRVEPGNLDAHILLEDLPAHAMRLGAGPVSIVASGEAVEGERVGAFVEVQEGACLLAYARGSSSIDDVDVAAFAEEGNPIASDERPDAHPAIVLCPPHRTRVYLVAHVASGEGLVALAAHSVARDRAAELARAFGARGGAGEGPRPADAWPGLEDHVRVHRDAVGGVWEEIRRVAVTLDARAPTFIGLSIEANQCVDVVVVPDEDVAMVEVEAQDGDGRVIARARDGGRDRSLTVCSPLSFDGSLTLRPHVGSGLAAVVLGRASVDRARDLRGRVQVAWVAAAAPLDVTCKAREAELAKSGYASASSTSNGTLVIGRRITLSIDLSARARKTHDGRLAPFCSRIDVVGGEPLALVDAEIWDMGGQLVTRAEGSSSVTLFSCARPKSEIDLEARGRAGPFTVLARPERWQDPAFANHPIAAARMLAASTSGPSAHIDGVPSAVKTFVVDATHRASFEESIRAGQCLDVAFGVEGEGSDLELRLFDASSSEEIDRDNRAFAGAVHACASAGQTRKVRIEARVGGGKLDLIAGERTRAAQ